MPHTTTLAAPGRAAGQLVPGRPLPGRPLAARLWRAHRPLTLLAAAMVPLTVLAAAGLALDDRVIAGAPAWAKPLKFAVSFLVYGLMWAWLLSYQTRYRRAGWWLGTVTAAAAAVETALITTQVLRGQASHYNTLTALDGALFSIMGATIMVLFLANLAWAVLLWRQDLGDRSVTWSIRAGTAVSLVGLAVAGLMLPPTADQRAALEAGRPTATGAHAVGVPDGGPGLPVLGWSTEGGDLRVPHFVGMHALQLLPLLAAALLLAARRVPALRDTATRARLVLVGSLGYLGLVALATWQALRGQSVVHPDAATLLTGAALLAATAIAAALVLRRTPQALSSTP